MQGLSHSERLKAVTDDLYRSLDEAGGSCVFSVQSAIHIAHAVKTLDTTMQSRLRPTVFKNDDGIQ